MQSTEAPQYTAFRGQIATFLRKEIAPHANQFDIEEKVPRAIIDLLAEQGYLGASLDPSWGGKGYSQYQLALLMEEVGKVCSSLRSLLTVHLSLVAETVQRWGTDTIKNQYLPALAKGEKIAAFCLSEPETGSDASAVQTRWEETEEAFVLTGVKKWTTFGQVADVFLVIAGSETGGHAAFLVDKNLPGLQVKSLKGILGTKASMLAQIELNQVEVPKENLLGKKGLGFIQIANTALDNGRFSVACGSVGIAKACLTESIAYAKNRKQFDAPIASFQLIKQKISQMLVKTKAAEQMCYQAAKLRDEKNFNAMIHTNMAKYFSSVAAMEIATEAVQIHGAEGCHEQSNVQRYFRDAKIMEIIEGSSEIQEVFIAEQAVKSLKGIIE